MGGAADGLVVSFALVSERGRAYPRVLEALSGFELVDVHRVFRVILGNVI